jgi:ComF family protein
MNGLYDSRFALTAALIRERLFPSGCACCGGPLTAPEEAQWGLCATCTPALFPVRKERETGRCDVCGRPLVSEQAICMNCRKNPSRNFDGIRVLFPYEGPYRKVLSAYKFGASRPLGCFFAGLLLNAHPEFPPEAVWVPVPPRPGKLARTGWDQVDYLARLLARRIPVSSCLQRLKSDVQKSLNREKRLVNLEGKFRLKQGCTAPKLAVVFDDVYTTGATIEACARILKNEGTEAVYGLCLFYN